MFAENYKLIHIIEGNDLLKNPNRKIIFVMIFKQGKTSCPGITTLNLLYS